MPQKADSKSTVVDQKRNAGMIFVIVRLVKIFFFFPFKGLGVCFVISSELHSYLSVWDPNCCTQVNKDTENSEKC